MKKFEHEKYAMDENDFKKIMKKINNKLFLGVLFIEEFINIEKPLKFNCVFIYNKHFSGVYQDIENNNIYFFDPYPSADSRKIIDVIVY